MKNYTLNELLQLYDIETACNQKEIDVAEDGAKAVVLAMKSDITINDPLRDDDISVATLWITLHKIIKSYRELEAELVSKSF